MQQTISINGFETVIEIPDGQVVSPVKVNGAKENYRIDYGNGLVEVGGEVEIATRVTNNHIEGSADIVLDLNTLLDVQVTAIDIAGAMQEGVHIQYTSGGFKIYAHANTTDVQPIKVKWTAKGLI